MARKAKYARYDPAIEAAISMTGRPDLFPDLHVPRMTALYWIRQALESDDPVVAPLAEAINDSKKNCDSLQKQVKEDQAVIQLVHKVHQILGFELRWKHITKPSTKSKILDSITIAMRDASRDQCLSEIGLSLSRYKRWRRDRKGCLISKTKSCARISANQLNIHEVQTMKDLVTSKKFSHFPILSLHYYAKREGMLYCSYSTWRKYIDLYGWLRPRKRKREFKKPIGIRAKFPNEIWRLDVSYFILPNKTKCFIQVVVENYSRFVVAWQIMSSYDGSKTGALLKRALAATTSPEKSQVENIRLLVDGGSENKGPAMSALEKQGKFTRQVARFEIDFSNSIVETVFRSLKHNYLFQHQITSLSSLSRHANFWFTEHNEKIPHSSFNGETPRERFERQWSQENEIRIVIRHEEAMKMRVKENQKISCEKCDAA